MALLLLLLLLILLLLMLLLLLLLMLLLLLLEDEMERRISFGRNGYDASVCSLGRGLYQRRKITRGKH
jgi:hypothetical protein